MGLFDKIFKDNNESTSTTSSSSVFDIQFTGFSRTNRDVAMKISALYSGVNLISETIASLPLYKYEIAEDGSKVRTKDKINYLLNRSCNGYITSFDMKDMLIKSAILEGNGYILIIRDSNFEIEKLVPLKKSEVDLRQINNIDEYMYYVSKSGYTGGYQYYEVLNLCVNSEDGVKGKGILELGRETIGLAQAQNDFVGSTMTNGSFVKGLISTPTNLSQTVREDISSKIKSFFNSSDSGSVIVLPEDLKFQNISLSPSDVQVLQSQEFSISEIARLLKISPHMIGSKEVSGNYGNLEQSNLNFLQYTLLPYLRRVEELCNMQLLTEEEKESGNYFFEFNIDNMLRTNRKDEIEYYVKALDAGVYSINEIRRKLNENKVEGLDIYTLSKFNSVVKNGTLINTVMSQIIEDENDISNEVNKV